jgi:TPP-dependent pyruvate/acetoin dehydrogenase alpha subunit
MYCLLLSCCVSPKGFTTIMRRSTALLGGHGGKSHTWVTSKGNPGQQFIVVWGFLAAFGGAMQYAWSNMKAEAVRLQAAKHHDDSHGEHH